MEKKTKVVNISKGSSYDIYIGRYHKSDKFELKKSKWCNPYKLSDYNNDRNKVIEMYKEYLVNNKELMKDLGELRGKVLGCWCKGKGPCHGDVLVELLNNQTKITDYFKGRVDMMS